MKGRNLTHPNDTRPRDPSGQAQKVMHTIINDFSSNLTSSVLRVYELRKVPSSVELESIDFNHYICGIGIESYNRY